MTAKHSVRDADTEAASIDEVTPRFDQPVIDEQVWTLLQTAVNGDRIMPIIEGDWEESARSYDSREAAACALIFDLSFYTNYRFSQVRRLFRQTGMRGVLSDEEIDDVVEIAYDVQDGRSYPTFG